MQPVTVTRDGTQHTRFGSFRHDEMIGMRFGSKMIASSVRGGFCYLLRPTPELWSTALRHRTQILYMPDIAFITSFLDLKPGTRVIEAGTGSGSFSHALARTVGPQGRVFSFEFHEQRTDQARVEFEEHGLMDTIELEHRNVCKDGFGTASEVDAVFLDLPAPWEAIESAKGVLAKDRLTRICCFSPCIEQVTKTVTALHEHGFQNITMYETLIRQHDMVSYPVPTIDDAIDKLKDIEGKKRQRHELQMAHSRAQKEARQKAKEAKQAATAADAAAPQTDSGADAEMADALAAVGNEALSTKKRKAEGETAGDAEGQPDAKKVKEEENGEEPATTTAAPSETSGTATPAAEEKPEPKQQSGRAANGKAKDERKDTNTKPTTQIRGHTSYLTFAVLLPEVVSAKAPAGLAQPVSVNDKLEPSEVAGTAEGIVPVEAV